MSKDIEKAREMFGDELTERYRAVLKPSREIEDIDYKDVTEPKEAISIYDGIVEGLRLLEMTGGEGGDAPSGDVEQSQDI